MSSLEWLSAREPRLDIVPPFQLIAFIGFPAEKHDPAVAHRGKIDQALLIVFQLNPQAFQFASMGRELYQQVGIARAKRHSAAALLSALRGLSSGALKSHQAAMRLLNRFDDGPNTREQ